MPIRTRLSRHGQLGYTYLGLLILVAVLSLVSAATLRVGVTVARHEAEQDLLDRGLLLTRALESYARVTPSGQSAYPRSINDLLRDPRFSKSVVRHLRRIDADPITGQTEWGVVLSDNGRGIAGFHSLSDQRAKRRDFVPPFGDFEDKPFYRDWVFVAGLGE